MRWICASRARNSSAGSRMMKSARVATCPRRPSELKDSSAGGRRAGHVPGRPWARILDGVRARTLLTSWSRGGT
eukprot:2147416-Prymnesium_polylepis.1